MSLQTDPSVIKMIAVGWELGILKPSLLMPRKAVTTGSL